MQLASRLSIYKYATEKEKIPWLKMSIFRRESVDCVQGVMEDLRSGDRELF